MKRAQVAGKMNLKIKRDAREKDREAHHLRKELIDLKH